VGVPLAVLWKAGVRGVPPAFFPGKQGSGAVPYAAQPPFDSSPFIKRRDNRTSQTFPEMRNDVAFK